MRARNLSSQEANARLLELAEEAVGIATVALENGRAQEAQQLLNLAMKSCPSSCPTVIGKITMLLSDIERRG